MNDQVFRAMRGPVGGQTSLRREGADRASSMPLFAYLTNHRNAAYLNPVKFIASSRPAKHAFTFIRFPSCCRYGQVAANLAAEQQTSDGQSATFLWTDSLRAALHDLVRSFEAWVIKELGCVRCLPPSLESRPQMDNSGFAVNGVYHSLPLSCLVFPNLSSCANAINTPRSEYTARSIEMCLLTIAEPWPRPTLHP